jgi:hypothetical protein
MVYKAILIPPPQYKGTLVEWTGLNAATQYRIVYRILNAEKRAVAAKLWRSNNGPKVAAYKKLYRSNNKEHIAAHNRIYYEDNQEQLCAQARARYIEKEKAFFEMFGEAGVI